MNTQWLTRLATLGPVGSFRGSGTYATIATIPLVILLSLTPYKFYAAFIGIGLIIAFFSIRYALPLFPQVTDPADIVVDEIVATLIAFWHVPLTFKRVLFGVILFRYIDIKKPWILKNMQHRAGAFWILLDDVLAAMATNAAIQVFLYLCSCS